MSREQVWSHAISFGPLTLFTDRFIVRDFVYSEELLAKQREDLAMADVTEKELWVSVLGFRT
jgi:hypothetical protein